MPQQGGSATVYNNPQIYIDTIKSKTIHPRFRLTTLYNNESEKEDISDYIIDGSGTLSINYQQGQRRSLNLTLNNEDGKFLPNANNNELWINSKLKLQLGIKLLNGEEYYRDNGIFVLSDPNATKGIAEKTISLQCYDKFAMLDGTLGGTLDATYEIPSGTPVKQAIKDILLLDNGNGYPIDPMPLIFDQNYEDEKTAYTITKSADSNLGEIVVELADMIACDVYYNESGNLVVQGGIYDIAYLRKPSLWAYSDQELEYINGQITYNFTKVKNRVIVVASNTNSNRVYSAIAENRNPQSPTRISRIGVRNIYVQDDNIYSTQLAQDRADYELSKISILQLTTTITSTYMIHLDVNNCITITDSYYNFQNERFVIQSITVPLTIGSQISITCSNVGSLPFYPSIS